MELVKQFNSELSALYEAKPPISKAKMTSITRSAIKAIKLYKHVVQSVEKFIQKCKPEYKVPGLYVIDSIVRQSRHQFGTEKDVFAPRFARNLQQTFIHLFSCPPEDKSKVIRVLNLWQKNAVFESEVIQPLFDLADPNHPVHKEQAALAPTNGITAVKPVSAVNAIPKNASSLKKESGTAGWINQLHIDSSSVAVHSNQAKPHAPNQVADVNILQQLQHLQTLLLDQTDKNLAHNKDSDQVKFDKKLLDFDYGEEEDDVGTPAQHHHQQQQQQVVAGLDSIGSILSNPEVLRQLQTLQQTLTNPQNVRQQQLDMEEKLRKMQEMRQQEEEFDKHLAQTIPNLPFADECELKPGGELSGFSGMDLSQPPPGYALQQKLMVPPGMMMKPPPSPLEDGEHASSDADERTGRSGEDGGQSVVVLDSDSPSDSPAHNRRRRRRSRSRSRSHRRSRSDSRSRSRTKRKRSSSYEEKDWEKAKRREAEKDKERERKRKGLPSLKKNHLAVCSTTLWIGHLSKLVQQEELSDTFGEFGDIVSIDLIPPRGCAFICMNRRQDAYRALQDLKHHKLQGKAITLAWAPGKGMKGREYKDFWEVEQGVSYIPWSKLTQDIDLELLEEGGMIDEESFPDWLKERQVKSKDDDQLRSQSSSQAEDDEASQSVELDIPVPAPTIPGFIPLPEGPQPTDVKVSQPPPNMPMSIPPLGMMPPFGLPNISRLLGPMGMTMGPGLLPNVPLGVPPPGMQGLMGNPLMHQQMISRMPQPVGSPFNPQSGVSILGGHPQLSQIPLPGNQDKVKAGLTPLGVPPPSDTTGLPTFGDALMQIPFTLPPQLQIPGMGMLSRPSLSEKRTEGSTDSETREFSSPSRPDDMLGAKGQFGHPPPQFSPMSLMKIPPPMMIPPPHSSERITNSEDKDEREVKDKDYRDLLKDYKEKDRERDRDYRSRRDRDFRGDRDYRDRFDKDYRDRDRDYRDREREKKDRSERSREKDDKMDLEIKDKDVNKDRKDDFSKDDRSYKDRIDRDKGRNRERDRGRDKMSKWSDRDRERGRERDREDKRNRDKEKDRSKEMKGGGEREKGAYDRQRPNDQERNSRGGMDSENFQAPGGSKFCPRNENFHQDEFQSDMQGHHPGSRRDGLSNRGTRDMFDHRGPLPDEFDPRGPPPDGFGNRAGPAHDNFNTRGSGDSFCRPPESFGPRNPPYDHFSPRGPPPDGFGPRGPPPGVFNLRGPSPGSFGPSDGFDSRGPPPDFDSQGPPPEGFIPRGPPDSFNRCLLPDNFGPGGPLPDGFPVRGPLGDDFNPQGRPSFEGFGGPQGSAGEFQPRIRIEFFPRGRGRGLQDSFRGRGGRGGMMFSPRGGGLRGPRSGNWMEGQVPSPPQSGFGFPPTNFPSPDIVSDRFGSPMFDDSGRGRGSQIRGRGFQGRLEEPKREDEDLSVSNPKRMSRWSNPSPPPEFTVQNNEESLTHNIETNDEVMVMKKDSKDCINETVSEPPTTSQQETSSTLLSDETTLNTNMEICDSQQVNSPNAAPSEINCNQDVALNNCIQVQQLNKNFQEESRSFSPNPGLLQDLELTIQSQCNTDESLNQSFDFDMSNITKRRTSTEKAGLDLGILAVSGTECSTIIEQEVDQLHTRVQQSLDSFNQNLKPGVIEEPQSIILNVKNSGQPAEDFEHEKTIHISLVGQKSSEIVGPEDHLLDQSLIVSSLDNTGEPANNQLLFDKISRSLLNDPEANRNSLQRQHVASEGEVKEENLGPSQISTSAIVSDYIENPAEAFDMLPVETQEKLLTAPRNGAEQNNCEINEPTTVTHEQNDNFDIGESVELTNSSMTN